ncbi:tail tape measure protein [Endozoicomonas montiporae CL-33]|uniref:Tail tape measure protein n=1 Tax=Endozoicomonas montiporae CL-33 TaxID=570277 RepID=A0A142BH76_9GAMM|nr:phage tail tape measure protein [Endozoicomonas montiporae]AMO58102.1 tail tape measure protein [Endozoicomonas montiporae CL-33]
MADTKLSVIIQAVDKVTAPIRKITRSTDKFSDSLGKQTKALSQLKGHQKNIDALKALQSKLGSTASELDKARLRTSQLAKELQKTSKPTKKLQQEFERSKKKCQKLATLHQTLRNETREMRGELRSAGIDTRHLGQASEQVAGKMGKLGDRMKAIEQRSKALSKAAEKYDRGLQRSANMMFVGEATRRVGQSFTNILRAPLQQAIDFESAMADVRKVVDFDTPEQFKAFGNQLKEMSKTIPITKEGLAEIAAAGGQLGVNRNALPTFVETVAKMSTAFDMLPEEAGDAMAKLANVYQIPISEMDKLGDVINHLSDNTAAKARDIVPALQRIGGTAKTFGLSAREAAALADAFIALGKPPEVASTAINALLIKLQTAEQQGAKFQDGLAELGYSASDLSMAIGDDAQGALSDFLESVSQLDNQSRAGVLANLFGTEYADDISLLTGSLEQYQKAVRLTNDETQFAGSMQREFDNRSNTTGNKIQLMQQRWQALQERIGQALLPVLERLMPKIENIIEGINKFVEESPGMTTGIVSLIGGIGTIALITAPVITAIAALTGAVAMLGFTAKKASLQMGGAGVGGIGSAGGKARKGGRLARAGKAMGGKLGLVGAGIGALSVGSTLMNSNLSAGEKAADVSNTAGSIGGALGGAKLGAALGTVIAPGIGTAVGGVLGSIIGGVGGSMLGDKIGSLFTGNDGEPEKAVASNLPKTGAAAAVTAALVATPAVAAPAPITQQQMTTVERIQIYQRPDEDAEALTERIMERIDEKNAYQEQGAQHDE